MLEYVFDYGLFLAKLGTVVVAIVVVGGFILSEMRRGAEQRGLTVEHLNRRFEELGDTVSRAVLGKAQIKQTAKQRKAERKELDKKGSQRQRVFVIDFKGDIRATATTSLREEVSAVLAVASEGDRVLVRLENAGGTVHEHGLAASQLLRIRQKELPLIIAVDKVAASGGYLMACVASHIIAAPFAIIGSIGVIAQLPNFNRWLEDKGVDFEQVTAGRFKRTLTLFGKNTEEGREKLREEIEDVHDLFKTQIATYRPQLDVEQVATGEYWYGTRALELGLIDEIRTSDDFLAEAVAEADLYKVSYKAPAALAGAPSRGRREPVEALIQNHQVDLAPAVWRVRFPGGAANERRSRLLLTIIPICHSFASCLSVFVADTGSRTSAAPPARGCGPLRTYTGNWARNPVAAVAWNSPNR